MSLFSQMTTKATLKRVAIGKSASGAPTKTTEESTIKGRMYELSASERATQDRDGNFSLFGFDVRPSVVVAEKDELVIDEKRYRVQTIREVKKGGQRVNHRLLRLDLVE